MKLRYDKERDFWWKVEPFLNYNDVTKRMDKPDIIYTISDAENGYNQYSFSLNVEGSLEQCEQRYYQWKKNNFKTLSYVEAKPPHVE